jgi:hypothetical protein
MTNQDNSNTLSERQLSAIPLILSSRTTVEAAEKTGTSRNTIYEWRKNPVFKAELQRQREMVVEEAMERLEMNVVKAVDTLGAMLDNPSTNIFYKRNVSLDIITHVMKIRERSKIAQLENRIADLERKLVAQSKVKQQ